jgi:hypothetical protein
LIYPIRPEPCRLYPLLTDFGAAGVNCPGSKEFKLVTDNFFKGRKYAAMWEPERYRKKIRPIPDREWPIIWRKLMKAKPSERMIGEFINLNPPVAKQFLHL